MQVWFESIAMALLIALYELCKRVQKVMDNTGNEIIQKKKANKNGTSEACLFISFKTNQLLQFTL